MLTGTQEEQLLDLEIARQAPRPVLDYPMGSPEMRYINYALSTQTRQLFAALVTKAAYKGKHSTVREMREFMQISRPAMNQMVAECEAEGWIDVQEDERGYRRCMAKPMLSRLWREYANDLYVSHWPK